MNRRGPAGAGRQSGAARRPAAGGTSVPSRSPRGRLPTWSWVWTAITNRSAGRSRLCGPRGRRPHAHGAAHTPVAPSAVDVDARPPRRAVPVREVGAVLRQDVALGAEVVVDDVEQ